MDTSHLTLKKKRGWRDVVALVGGHTVCCGDLRFVADALGIAYGSLRSYMLKDPVPGLSIISLPEMWLVDGVDEPVTSDEAAAVIGCLPEEVCRVARGSGTPRVNRVRWVNRSLPHEVIDQMRQYDKALRKDRLQSNVPA